MKGISAIIGTILILMITMALSGMAYFYIFGIYTSKTLVIEGTDIPEVTKEDSTCSITWKIRNLAVDTVSVSLNYITPCTQVSVDDTPIVDNGNFNVPSGQTKSIVATGCTQNKNAIYRARGPSNSISLIAYCP